MRAASKALVMLLALMFSLATAHATPLVILASGQSNFALTPTFAWSPNANAKIWNWAGDGTTGTAFVALDSTTIGITQKVASDLALNTGRMVCLINISIPGESISHWLSGTASPDVYQNIVNAMGPALTACGATQVDLLDWWQGEADSVPLNASYAANFETMISRLKGNAWFPAATPIIIHGIASVVDGGAVNANADLMNNVLKGIAAADPANRSYVYPSSLHGSAYWDASNLGHMTGLGYFYGAVSDVSAYMKDAPVRYSPRVICQSTGLPPTNASGDGWYTISGKTVHLSQTASIVTAGSCAYSIIMDLPLPAASRPHTGIAYDSGYSAKSGGAVITPLYSLTQTGSRIADGTSFAHDGAVVSTFIEYTLP